MKSGTVVGISGMDLVADADPGAEPAPNLPKGVMRKDSGSTYQYQVPSTTFQVLGIGILIGLPMKPGSMMYCSVSTVTLARVKLSE
jgi:hypothetical protein